MIVRWEHLLILTVVICAIVVGVFCAAQITASGKHPTQHGTVEHSYIQWLEREKRRRQPSDEEKEVVKMCFSMSHLADKAVTTSLKALDSYWQPTLDQYEPSWPRCSGSVLSFVELTPPARGGLRRYVTVNGTKGELTTYPTPVPWLAGWALRWDRTQQGENSPGREQKLHILVEWLRSVEALNKEWPVGGEASYEQVYGGEVATVKRYAVKHVSFTDGVIGDDIFFPYGCWSGFERRYSKILPTTLVFRKANFRCRISAMVHPPTDEEKEIMDEVARLIEAQIIAYSLFGLEKFTVLQTQVGDKEFYLPAGRMSAGNYFVPIGYVVQRVTGQRPVYGTTTKQMKVNIKGQQANLGGEVIAAANKWVEIPEAERLVASLTTLRESLDMGAARDLRFEE